MQHDSSVVTYDHKRVADPPGFDPAATREQVRRRAVAATAASAGRLWEPKKAHMLSLSVPLLCVQGEGSSASGGRASKLPLQKRQELLQAQATAPFKQVRRLCCVGAEIARQAGSLEGRQALGFQSHSICRPAAHLRPPLPAQHTPLRRLLTAVLCLLLNHPLAAVVQSAMLCFMMWMSGSTLHLFSIMMTINGIYQPLSGEQIDGPSLWAVWQPRRGGACCSGCMRVGGGGAPEDCLPLYVRPHVLSCCLYHAQPRPAPASRLTNPPTHPLLPCSHPQVKGALPSRPRGRAQHHGPPAHLLPAARHGSGLCSVEDQRNGAAAHPPVRLGVVHATARGAGARAAQPAGAVASAAAARRGGARQASS